MPKGTGKKPDNLKSGENPPKDVVTQDSLSAVDKGYDFIKSGETAQIGRGN